MIFVIRLVSNRRRLLRKRMYRAPHERARNQYFRENKNRVKVHQQEFKQTASNVSKRRKLRPKREVTKGFKMAYRYRYYNNVDDLIEEDDFDDSS